MKLNDNIVAFTGGGTAGHIIPGLAVADELKQLAQKNNKSIEIYWIGCSKGMDKNIVEKAVGTDGNSVTSKFYGISSGKLRRYLSWQNFTDLFRIAGGYFQARKILKKLKPAVLFSKGGFVSVPPCLAAKHLGIPVFTHECDFTLGLANRLNFKSAKTMFVSYEETKNRLSDIERQRVLVSGNPVRPVIYNANKEKGREFLEIPSDETKPVLLVLGGSSGAKQINTLVAENLAFLCKNYIVVHQTGLINDDKKIDMQMKAMYGDNYKPYAFIYDQMPDVLAAADVILSRAGANSIWEAAVLNKPMVLVPLCGSGTRGDQVDNAKFFEDKNAAIVLLGENANNDNLCSALEKMLDNNIRQEYIKNVNQMTGTEKPSLFIANYIYNHIYD